MKTSRWVGAVAPLSAGIVGRSGTQRPLIRLAGLACALAAAPAARTQAQCETAGSAETLPLNQPALLCDVVVSSEFDHVSSPATKSFHVQDGTGGVTVFGNNASVDAILSQVNEGDQITLQGTTGTFNGVFELLHNAGVQPLALVSNSGFVGVPSPHFLQSADLADGNPFAEFLESQLAFMPCVQFLTTGTFAGNTNYQVSDGSGVATVRISSTCTTIVGQPIPSQPVAILGIVTQFDTTDPRNGDYQLLPRTLSDMTPCGGSSAACCFPDGSCSVMDPVDCTNLGGGPQGPGSVCLGDNDGDGLDDACAQPPCADCGPGAHWIHAPACPPGGDQMPSAALVGIDMDLDCVADSSMILSGPVSVNRGGGQDDSTNYPGLRPVDGHLDVIDTEMEFMRLIGGGVTLTAGAGQGAQPLAATLGTIAEQPGDPALADSFFDVFFEVDLGGQFAYNQAPLRITSTISCIPPNATYIHPVGCIALYDSPSGGTHIANLVTANHDTYPQPGACCLSGGGCVEELGGECQLSGGSFQGEGTTCGPTSCLDCIDAGQDCWSTECGGTQTSFSETPIPADFFDPGSQPFQGTIELGGDTGSTIDTLLERQGQLCFSEPLPSSADVPIQLVQLSLVSCEPIFVQGSQGSGLWDVRVSLSGPQPPGSMTVTKDNADGGTFSASFFVQPVFTFTRTDPPHDVRTFDTALEGRPPVALQTVGSAPWRVENPFESCDPDGFAPGTTSRFGQACCEEVCHSSFGSAPHEHCTRPPGCPECPSDIGACCLPTGECAENLPESQCEAMGGQGLGSGSICPVPGGRGAISRPNDGDFNDDVCVDQQDTGPFVQCLSGPLTAAGAGCESGDFNADLDVDLRDIAAFLQEFDPDCPRRVPAGEDCWTTPCLDGNTAFDCCNNPIPADFFDPGSLPFDGLMFLGSATPGSTDTRMARMDEMLFPSLCSQAQTPIQLVQLDLSSCEPIAVDSSGGGSTFWNVQVSLSTTSAPTGMLTATKTHPNGGVFDSSFFVLPVFTFSEVGNPGNIRILDTGAGGYEPFMLATTDKAPWVGELDPDNPAIACATNFVPGVEGSATRAAQCCKLVGHAGPGHIHQTGPPNCSGCPRGACCDPNTGGCFIALDAGDCTANGGQYKGDGTNCNDNDGDRIPDVFENNNCCGPRDLCNTGTSPTNPDTDGDGISDGDEVYGTLAGLNLPALGANPCHKDIFVETDWTDDAIGGPAHSHRPTAPTVAAVVAAFAAAPVTNPDNVNGINMHVDFNQGPAPYTGGNLIPGSPAFLFFEPAGNDFNALKAVHFAANRKGYFHYSIWTHRYNNVANNSSGIAEINADDFMVTLQTVQTVSNASKTFMHELGHNLNLRHGGFENKNYKPNYNSIMNYRFQFPGIDGADCNSLGNGILSYSVGTRIALNEAALNENAGVCGAPAIDWNGNAVFENPVARNINCSAGNSTACGVQIGACYDPACDLLNDYNDWANIVYNNLVGGDRAAIEIITCQETPEKGQPGAAEPVED